MSNLDVIKQLYKPYRLTIKNKVTVLETTTGKYIVKEKHKDLNEIFNYLKSRNFEHFPKLIDSNRSDVDIYEYIEDIKIPLEQKAIDMIDLISQLHYKTTYYKKISEDSYKSIYEDILNNINYLRSYYQDLFKQIDEEVYMSPSHYLLIRNSSKLMACLDFASNELESWYENVKKDSKQRVALIHNNLKTEHFLESRENYLISWDKAKIDTPVLDLVNFYKNEYLNVDFETLFEKYLSSYSLNENEKKLFFILITLMDKITFDEDELKSCQNIRLKLDYLYITENLIRPYYSKEEEKE